MHENRVIRFRKEVEAIDPLTELLRHGARDLIEQD